MALTGISSSGYDSYYTYNYGYNNGISSDSWTDSANKKTEELKKELGISDSESTTSSSGSTATTASSASGFLMGYQTRLEELEASASKLQLGTKDNVFAKYDKALESQAKGEEGAADKVQKAEDDVVSAIKDLVKNYNDTISYLKKNGSYGAGLSKQMESLQRSIPTEQGLKYFGMGFDTNGNLKIKDEDKLRETLKNDSEYVKESFGGQYGIADRLGSKATAILDSSVDKVLGSGATDDTSKTTSSSTVTTYTGSGGSSNSTVNDSFKQFASFAKSGAFNLSNYYAVSMLNILV